MPTSAATARAVASLSPVSSTVRRPSACSRSTASAEVGLTVSATASRPRTSPSQATSTAVRPCASASRRAASSASGTRRLHSRHQRRAADLDAAPADHALDAEALAVDERLDGLERRRARGRRRRSPARSGARRRPRARRRRPAAPPRRCRPRRTTRASAIRPRGHGAGLVEHDRVDAAGGLEDLRALDQQPELRAAAGADEQRGRRGEPERARAGDDQHGDGGGEREREVLARADPEAERGDRDADHDRHEDARDPVGEPLDGRLARLRLGDQPRDLRERGVGADLRRAHDQPAAGVDARARDLVAGLLLDRHGLAGQQRLVDGGVAGLDDAVGGDLLARAHDEAVADGELLDRHAALARRRGRGSRRPWRRAPAAPSAPRRRGAWRAPRSSARRG